MSVAKIAASLRSMETLKNAVGVMIDCQGCDLNVASGVDVPLAGEFRAFDLDFRMLLRHQGTFLVLSARLGE
jgi:hypothetical protein